MTTMESSRDRGDRDSDIVYKKGGGGSFCAVSWFHDRSICTQKSEINHRVYGKKTYLLL